MSRPLPPPSQSPAAQTPGQRSAQSPPAGRSGAHARAREFLPRCADADEAASGSLLSLQEAQHIVACEYGFKHWEMLCAVVEADLDRLAGLSNSEAQQLMREIDQKDMVVALKGANAAVQDLFLSNISARVAAYIRAEIEISPAAESLIRDTRKRLLLQAATAAAQGEIQWPDGRPRSEGEKIAVQFQPPEHLQQIAARPLDQLTVNDLIDLWTGLAVQVQSGGILSLNDYAESVAGPFLREALQLAVDGCEPDLLRDMLETRLDHAFLQYQKTRGRMVVEGTMALLSGDDPLVIRHKLGMFIAEPPPGWADGELDELTAAELAAQLRQTPVPEMRLEQLAEFYGQASRVVRVEGVASLRALSEALQGERDLAGELVCRGLDMMLDEHIMPTSS